MLKKLFILIVAIILGALWLVACSNELVPGATKAQSKVESVTVSGLALVSNATTPPSTFAKQGHGPSTSGNVSHTVFIIMMENHDWSQIKDNEDAPYLNTVLLPMAAYANQYYNPPKLHPSEPNYLWLEAGTNFSVTNDENPDVNHQSTTMHLVTLLKQKGISWKSYQEDISGTDCPLVNEGLYTPKHNPMIFFDDVTDTNNPNSTYCIAHIRPFSELAVDLQNNTIARYNFITPNLCNDMHGDWLCHFSNGIRISSNPIRDGDEWLANNVPNILSSQAYVNGGVLFIVWDEGTDEAASQDGPIGMIVLSPNAKGGGYSNTIHYTHSSLLRTVQEIFGVTPLLGDAAQATDLSDLFVTLP